MLKKIMTKILEKAINVKNTSKVDSLIEHYFNYKNSKTLNYSKVTSVYYTNFAFKINNSSPQVFFSAACFQPMLNIINQNFSNKKNLLIDIDLLVFIPFSTVKGDLTKELFIKYTSYLNESLDLELEFDVIDDYYGYVYLQKKQISIAQLKFLYYLIRYQYESSSSGFKFVDTVVELKEKYPKVNFLNFIYLIRPFTNIFSGHFQGYSIANKFYTTYRWKCIYESKKEISLDSFDNKYLFQCNQFEEKPKFFNDNLIVKAYNDKYTLNLTYLTKLKDLFNNEELEKEITKISRYE